MAHIEPTTAGLVRPQFRHEVPSPAFDALSLAQRQQLRAAHPNSYLNVTRSPEEEPAGRWASTSELLADCRATLDRLIADGVFDLDQPPGFYGYELVIDGHRQLGLIADVAVADLANRAIRPHEETKTERGQLLAQHLSVVEAQSSPIAVAYRAAPGAVDALRKACERTPDLTIDMDDGLLQNVWRLSSEQAQPVLDAIGDQPLYLVDGHHRAAANIARHQSTTDPAGEHVLAAIFAADELLLLEYNRWVQDTGRRPMAEVLADLAVRVGLEPVDGPADARPERAGELGVYARGQWYRGWLSAPKGEARNLVESLDPVVLQREVLASALDIADAESDERLQYLPGGRPLESISAQVDAHGGIAFVLAPLDFDLVCRAADAGDVLPPKSTYFEPKVRSGVFLRTIGQRRIHPIDPEADSVATPN